MCTRFTFSFFVEQLFGLYSTTIAPSVNPISIYSHRSIRK